MRNTGPTCGWNIERRALGRLALIALGSLAGASAALAADPVDPAAMPARAAAAPAARPAAAAGPKTKGRAAAAHPADLVKRGEYLITTGGCHDCHTPRVFNKDLGLPMPDMTRALSGHPEGAPEPTGTVNPKNELAIVGLTFTSFKTAFGTIYSYNLTPDSDTGLGSWTEEMFVKALRTGWHQGVPGSRPVLPPMPWWILAARTDEDLKAMWAYLRSIPPIKNGVPNPKVAQPILDGMSKNHDKVLEVVAKRTPHGSAPPLSR